MYLTGLLFLFVERESVRAPPCGSRSSAVSKDKKKNYGYMFVHSFYFIIVRVQWIVDQLAQYTYTE